MTREPTTTLRSDSQAVVSVLRHNGRLYESRLNDCGKAACSKCGGEGPRHPSHGPYWYLCVPAGHRWRRIYLGRDLDTKRYIGADGKVDWKQIRYKPPHGGQVDNGVSADEPGQLSILQPPPEHVPPPRPPSRANYRVARAEVETAAAAPAPPPDVPPQAPGEPDNPSDIPPGAL